MTTRRTRTGVAGSSGNSVVPRARDAKRRTSHVLTFQKTIFCALFNKRLILSGSERVAQSERCRRESERSRLEALPHVRAPARAVRAVHYSLPLVSSTRHGQPSKPETQHDSDRHKQGRATN